MLPVCEPQARAWRSYVTPSPLPDRPNLEQLKKQAKSLLHAAEARDRRRARALRGPAGIRRQLSPTELARPTLALHDAQSVIAREHGFASWNALREEVEARTLSFDGRRGRVRPLRDGRRVRPRACGCSRCHPGIASRDAARRRSCSATPQPSTRGSRDHPELATRAGGRAAVGAAALRLPHLRARRRAGAPRRVGRDRARALSRSARIRTPSITGTGIRSCRARRCGARICAIRHLPLAEVLLEAGANPTDGVSTHIAGGGGDLDALELLHRFGVNVNGIPGGVPPLVYMMLWATNPAGPRWLLEHGADRESRVGPDGEAPLHVAARRWDVPMVETARARTAPMSLGRRADGCTPHTLAELHGNHDVAAWLLAHGAADELSPLERFVAACARGDRAAARRDARRASRPRVPSFVPNTTSCSHRPGRERQRGGARDDARVRLRSARARQGRRHGPPSGGDGRASGRRACAAEATARDVNALDGMFSATPLVWAVEGRGATRQPAAITSAWRGCSSRRDRPLEWTPPEGAPGPERTIEGLIELRRAAAAA